MEYGQMFQELLAKKNPEELERLKAEGKLPETLADVEALYGDQEAQTFQQMCEQIEQESLSEQEKLGRKNVAAMCAREVANSDLQEFVSNLK